VGPRGSIGSDRVAVDRAPGTDLPARCATAGRRRGALASLFALCGATLTPVAGIGSLATLWAQDGIPRLGLLPEVAHATMAMKLEKTIFKVDVLMLSVRVDPETAAGLDSVVAAESDYDRNVAPTIAERAIRASEAVASIEFLRNVSLEQFLDAVDEDMRKAVAAGWLEPGGYEVVSDGLPVWFDFLRARGIRDGDRISYHVEGDSLRTVYSDPSGQVLLDQTDVGRQHVLALLGAYFAPGSSFREGLIRSLWRPATP